MQKYHPKWECVEESALKRCKLAIYASEWAAQTAIQNYQIDESKVRVVPFGANIKCDRDLDDIKGIIRSRPSNKCKLLFVGVDWSRKGGNLALRVTNKLNQMGLDTELSIVGCDPPQKEKFPDYVKCHGFLSKKTGYGIKKLNRLFSEAHFFILPTRSEAFGVVFFVASLFAVPSIATAVGGITTAVKDGKNGKLFSLKSDIEEYCSFIMDCFSNYKNYQALAFSSFSEYQSRLNWTVSGMTVKRLLENLI